MPIFLQIFDLGSQYFYCAVSNERSRKYEAVIKLCSEYRYI